MSEMTCRYDGANKPRLLRSHLAECEGVCEGCQPCPENHCGLCGREHVGTDLTCPRCIGNVREDGTGIMGMSSRLLDEAIVKGVNSEAANLAGPVADPEAWSWRKVSAEQGRASHITLTEDDESTHPAWVLGTWEMLVREHLEQPSDDLLSIESAWAYLAVHLHRLANDGDFAFEELARDLRLCRGHLEDVLCDGEREERGAPCPTCTDEREDKAGPRLVRKYNGSDTSGASDSWHCPRDLNHWWREADYRQRIGTKYLKHATALTARQMHDAHRVSEGSVRGWASLGKVRKRGKDANGLTLYDVADTLAMRDGSGLDSEAIDGVA